MFHEPLDRAPFSGCVSSFKNQNDFLIAVLDPVLSLDEFYLPFGFSRFILFSR